MSANAHIMDHENGNIGALAHCFTHTIPEVDGLMPLEDIAAAIKRRRTLAAPATVLLYLESPTFSGKVPGLAYLQAACALAHQNGMRVHLDGARSLNAAAFLGVHPR